MHIVCVAVYNTTSVNINADEMLSDIFKTFSVKSF